MDGYLAVVSKREVREYANRLLPREQLDRILEAGRATGSSRNRQPWHFVAVTDRTRLSALAETVRAPENIRGCAAAIAVAMESPNQAFDAGRVAQDMMVAAWSDGVGSCPNSSADQEATKRVLELDGDRHIAIILSLGYPRHAPNLNRDPASVLRRIDRKPLEQLVDRL